MLPLSQMQWSRSESKKESQAKTEKAKEKIERIATRVGEGDGEEASAGGRSHSDDSSGPSYDTGAKQL